MKNEIALLSIDSQYSQLFYLESDLQIPIENPSNWMRTGNSSAEVILAAAFLISVSIGATATLITATTNLVKVFMPVILRLLDQSHE